MEEKTSKTKNPFVKIGRWCVDTVKWLFDIKDWKMLLRSVPGLVTALFVVSVVVMNMLAAKTIVMTEPSWLGITGGLLLSWIPFLCMDAVVKVFGAKAATKLNILGLLINLGCIGMFQLVASVQIGGDPNTYAAFNATFTQTWQIFVASSIAFVLSGITNNVINVAVGNLFKKNPDGKLAYVTRTYVSTMIGQFIDNFVFASIVSVPFFGWSWFSVFACSFFGMIVELVFELIFSPLTYKISKNWKKNHIGEYWMTEQGKLEAAKEIIAKSNEVSTNEGIDNRN